MPEQPRNSRSRIPLYILIVLLYLFVTFQGDEKSVLSESVSGESNFQVYLTEGVSYELWVENPEGPDKIDVIISNGSYIAFQSTFVLARSKKRYLPYHPEFRVKENGTYRVHAKPHNPGTFSLEIRKPKVSEQQ
ncbi:hypothetical protein RSJ42_00615 [Methanosarcina hadiensis]|uniref:hypothetical protein n=1 Tax=Methanosarcina hadiensis TaxID=3078083 RepID=UPI00397759A3